jgi:hypothetical protein
VGKLKKSLLILVFTSGLALFGLTNRCFGIEQFNLDDETATTPTVSQKSVAPAPTATPASQSIQIEDNTQPGTQVAPTPTAAAATTEINGQFQMKYMYEAGIKYYNEKDYGTAIRYLTNALKITDDPYTPKYIYAEANAMLGIIYQYHIIHRSLAYWHYKAALKYEPGNKTARRHIKQVYKYRNRKD